ncbi:MAG: PEP-CTERM sorting domain-containing protein [Verrucomicrobiia bacterium]
MRVTIKTIAGLTGLAGLLIGNSAIAQNLILNPGFETGDTTSWLTLGTGTDASITVRSGDNGPSAPGTYSAFMDNNIQANNLALQQSTALGDAVPGLVDYSFDAEGNTSFNGGVFFVHIWDINSTGGVIDQGPGLLQPSLTTGSWTTFNGSWTAPVNVNHFEIEFDCTTGAEPNSTEHLYVDNVSLTQVPEPASLSLAAMGLLGVWTFRRSRKA